MTTDTLLSTISTLLDLDGDLRIQNMLEAVGTSLASLAQSPAQPAQQQVLASTLGSLVAAMSALASTLKPTLNEALAELNGTAFFNPSIAEDVRASIAANGMTPSVARDYVQDFVSRRGAYLSTLKQLKRGLDELGLQGADTSLDRSDVAFRVPRDLFNGEVKQFAKELLFFDRLIGHISEASNETEVATLAALSSSTPTVVILAGFGAISLIAQAVKAFLDAWKAVLEFREAREKLTKLGLTANLTEVDNKIEQTIDEVVETTTTTIVNEYQGDPGRKSELRIALTQDARRLFGQIERGLVVEFTVRESQDAAVEGDLLNVLAGMTADLEFPVVATAPLLLSAGEVLEGDLERDHPVKRTETTVTEKRKRSENKTRGV